jgi:hypothetical protein
MNGSCPRLYLMRIPGNALSPFRSRLSLPACSRAILMIDYRKCIL